jgi:hypothetical protein
MINRTVLPPARPGDVLALKDEDYLFGQGDLVLRVEVIHEVRQFKDGPWVFLRGLELRSDGNARRRCDVLVRGAAMYLRRRQPS